MEIKRELNVNRHELYELIINSALEDIRKYKPNTTAKDLHSGFYYEKNLNGNEKKKSIRLKTARVHWAFLAVSWNQEVKRSSIRCLIRWKDI